MVAVAVLLPNKGKCSNYTILINIDDYVNAMILKRF